MYSPILYSPTTPWADMNRLFRELNEMFEPRSGGGYPKLNMYTRDDGALVTVAVPGADPSKLEVNLENETLTVSGEIAGRTRGEGESCHRNERFNGRFSRSLRLPFRVDAKKVAADYRHGILEVELPRAEEDKPRKIAVKAR